MNASGILLAEVSNDIAEGAAGLRAKYNLKTPDAIQVATALENQADYFFTKLSTGCYPRDKDCDITGFVVRWLEVFFHCNLIP